MTLFCFLLLRKAQITVNDGQQKRNYTVKKLLFTFTSFGMCWMAKMAFRLFYLVLLCTPPSHWGGTLSHQWAKGTTVKVMTRKFYVPTTTNNLHAVHFVGNSVMHYWKERKRKNKNFSATVVIKNFLTHFLCD